MRGKLIYCVFITLFVSTVRCLILEAQVHLNGIRGTVTFSQDGSNTNVNFNLTGVSNPQAWSIRSNRMTYFRKDKCTNTLLGANYIPSSGTLQPDGQATVTILTSDLPDLDVLTGRSILLIDSVTSKRTCATIENNMENFNTAIAKLQSVIGGNIYFRQASSSSPSISTTSTSIYANVFHLVNTNNAGSTNVSWGIYTGTCTYVGTLFNPTGSSGTSCDRNNQRNCKIGDLSAKNSDLSVDVNPDSSIISYVDSNLPLDGANSIVGNILVLKANNGSFLTCSKIVKYMYREVSVEFSRKNVKGDIKFKQQSPLDVTTVTVNLRGLQNLAGGYHVHKWPVPDKLTTDQDVCNNEYVSGHFNPFEIDTATDPSPGLGTTDQYEIGDISGKFGLLNGMNETSGSFYDYNLPLFGTNSIVGRSLVIHYSNGNRMVCSNIDYAETANITIGMATFTYPAIGYIIFKQNADIDLEIADTTIFIQLNYGDTRGRTVGHNWHIHVKTMGNDTMKSTGRCMSVLGHYNPFSVDLETDGTYGTDCGKDNPLRCEVGDLSKKHGQIAIRTSTGSMERNFFTDVDLPLVGDLKILGRSIVIHDQNSGGGRLSCANIYTLPTRKVIVKSGTWSQESSGTADGVITMTERADGLSDGVTQVNMQLTGLSSLAGGYHVHVNPVPPPRSSNPCSNSMVGGHFNPFGVNPTAGPIDGSGTNDEYEIGDLSRKYGTFLNGKMSLNGKFDDTMLPLRGPLSVTGRSVVIHKSESGAPRWVCGNITEDTASTGGTLFEAKASFSNGPLRGYIYLTQYIYSDGGLSDTGVLVDLHNTDGQSSNGHNWHVHEKPVGNDATSGCMSTGPHFNPFMVDVNNGYSECNPTNPLRCELGDQASKLGRYDIGSGRKFYTDIYLPIIGKSSVIGRSFVIHAAGGGAPRIACTDILPVNGMNPILMTFNAMNFSKSVMVNQLADVLHTSPSNLATSEATSDGPCMSVNVFITGMNAQSLYSDLMSMRNSQDEKLGAYVGTDTCSSCIHVASFVLCAVVFFLQRYLTS